MKQLHIILMLSFCLLPFLGANAGANAPFWRSAPVPKGEVVGAGKDKTPPARRIKTVNYLGRPHFRIKTRTATYLYDPVAGGFSSIFDKLGNDWVGYQDEPRGEYPASAASSYRGVPNLVFGGDDGGVGHPGHKKCESRVTGRNKIHTASTSGDWAWTWTFYATYARLDVVLAPEGVKYWFLYEGPAGGKYLPRSTFWATDLTGPSYDIHDHFQGDVQRGQHRYLYCGEDHNPYVFYMAQKTPDTLGDHISYLGNEEIGARDSPDGMVVAGFGRAEAATPLLSGPNTFLIGLAPYRVEDPLAEGRFRRRMGKLLRRR